MSPELGAVYIYLILFAVLAGILILVLWIALPFAVFGTKPRLDELIELNRQIKTLLERQANNETATKQGVES